MSCLRPTTTPHTTHLPPHPPRSPIRRAGAGSCCGAHQQARVFAAGAAQSRRRHAPCRTVLTWVLLLMHVPASGAACDYAVGRWVKANPKAGLAYNTASCLRDANVR